MAKLIDEHTCEACDNQTYFLRLKEKQPVRIAKGGKNEYAFADYALVKFIKVTDPDTGSEYHETSVVASDKEQKPYEAVIYSYNRLRDLNEVIWTLGGEWGEPDAPIRDANLSNTDNH